MNDENVGGKTLSQYLGNPFVLIGIALLGYWFFTRRKLIYENPNLTKSSKIDSEKFDSFIENEKKAKKYNVPIQLVNDCDKMNAKQIAKIILDNQNMINNTKMSNDEKNQILKMVNFLESELDIKMD